MRNRSVVAPWRAVVLAGALAAVGIPAAQAARPAAPARRPYVVLFDNPSTDARTMAADQSRRLGLSVISLIDTGLRGYVGSMTDAVAKLVAALPGVRAVAPDTPFTVAAEPTATTQTLSDHPPYSSALPKIWGLDRIDQGGLPPNGTYRYDMTGSGVTAYVVDTGVKSTHIEFDGRVRSKTGFDAYRATSDAQYGEDCDGHGTHVAGILGGRTFGVAKRVNLVSVRVLDCTGSGLASNIVNGISWMIADHGGGPAVANMSFGGGTNAAIDAAVKAAVNDGITVAVAAGNGGLLGVGQDACSSSPAHVPEVITVGGTDAADKKASWSNYGPCLDVFAPGDNIVSAYGSGDNTATKQLSGTSMASPHVAGVAALILSAVPTASPADVSQALSRVATAGLPTSSNTANPKLLFAPSNLVPGQLPTAGAPPSTPPGPPPSTPPGPPPPTPCSGLLGCLLG